MYNKLSSLYIKTINKMFFIGFCVSAVDINKYNKNQLINFNKCVYNGFLFAIYPITIPYNMYKLIKKI